MKPTEYYNYPQKRKRIWWLPLALVLVMVIITVVFDPFGTKEAAAPTDTTGGKNEAVNSNYHSVLLEGQRYNILDGEYTGDFDLQHLRFSTEAAADNRDGTLTVPVEPGVGIPADFNSEAVLDRTGYEAFCETWGLTPAFPEHKGRFAVVAYGVPNSSRCEVQLGDAAISGQTVTLVLRDRLSGFAADSLGFVLTVPVPETVTALKTEPLYNQAEYENLKQYGNPWGDPKETQAPEKPVIYLYPEAETEVRVRLDYDGELTCTYPAYRDGWTVTARPDGTLTDAAGQQYNYLYWEGLGSGVCDFSQSFCVRGREVAAFLEEALAQLGLTRREANEFIVYWLPQMEDNPWNLISFQTDAYTERARLTVEPAPDTLLRVFMAWKPLDAPVAVEPQILTAPERAGFTVVEWGGCVTP